MTSPRGDSHSFRPGGQGGPARPGPAVPLSPEAVRAVVPMPSRVARCGIPPRRSAAVAGAAPPERPAVVAVAGRPVPAAAHAVLPALGRGA
ncbi:hypothetical protein SRB17_03460 [Streptomyces sp. RB17]|uniref:hypothetical protein n=1 Tax=Streptomyces sp. RB17 TaxID=2585197 RepID=UPI001295D969|nr:hypothetical protein [Streptomyces sp. RB17]MQY32398.1 hypothetical protein [Streptomyces sp. RB17]